MEPSNTSQTRWERHHNTFKPSLHLVPFCQLYALSLLVVCIAGLWKTVGRVLLGVVHVDVCGEYVCCGWMQCTCSGLLRDVRAAQCVHQTTPNMRSTGSTELPRFQVAGKLANYVRSTTSNSHSCGLRTCLRAKKR